MKKSKILKGVLVVILTTVLIYSCGKEQMITDHSSVKNESTEFRGEEPVYGDPFALIDLLGESCVPSSIIIPGCNDSVYIQTTTITDHEMYPGCTFKVVYKMQLCQSQNLIDLTVGDFQIIEHNCQAFSEDLNNNYNTLNFREFMTNFETKMWNSISQILTEQVSNSINITCGEGAVFNINYIRTSCYKYVALKSKTNLYETIKVACGTQCCERHSRICRKSDGSYMITTYDVTRPWNITCDLPNTGIPTLIIPPSKIVWISECSVTCPN